MLSVWAAAVAVPTLLILYFLKLKRRDVEVSTTLLWKRAIQDLQANAPFKKLRKNILLLLQLLALALVILALGQPQISGATYSGSRHVIMIDRSASMGATDVMDDSGQPITRLDKAKVDALAYIDALREPGILSSGFLGEMLGGSEQDEAMVIAFDETADVRQSYTSDKQLLRRAVLGITGTDAPTRIDEAMRLAGAYAEPEVIEGRGLVSSFNATIALWSDGRIEDAATASPPKDAPLYFNKIGEDDAGNVAITAIRAERSYEDVARLGVFVGLQSTDPERAAVDVELSVDNIVVAVRSVDLIPNEADPSGRESTGGVVFEMNRIAGGVARARVLVEDPLTADNQARLILPPARRLSVALVTRGNLFLQSALEGMNLARLVVVPPSGLESALRSGEFSDVDVVVLDGAPLPTLDGEIPPGRYLVFNAGEKVPGVTLNDGGDDSPTVIIDWAREHPALQLASLDQIIIGGHRDISVDSPARVLARSERGPVIVETAEGGVRAMLVAFDPAASTWPFQPGYVLFLASATQHLGQSGEAAAAAPLAPGQTLSTNLPDGAQGVQLRLPGGETVPLTPGNTGRVTYGPLRQSGLYEIRWSGDPGPRDLVSGGTVRRVFAVNMADPDESDIASTEIVEMASRTVEAGPGGAESVAPRRLWPWCILAALGIVLLEWFVYNRKVAI
jgi:hypothetical protein